MSSTLILLSNCDATDVPDNGYIIVGHKLYQVKDGYVSDTWQLTGFDQKGLERSARKQANLHTNTLIYFDDDDLICEQRLVAGELQCNKRPSGDRKGGFYRTVRQASGI